MLMNLTNLFLDNQSPVAEFTDTGRIPVPDPPLHQFLTASWRLLQQAEQRISTTHPVSPILSLSFTGRHRRYLTEKVEEGIYATTSAAVAAAIERMIEDERERDIALGAMAEEIRRRANTPPSEFVDLVGDSMFDTLRAQLHQAGVR